MNSRLFGFAALYFEDRTAFGGRPSTSGVLRRYGLAQAADIIDPSHFKKRQRLLRVGTR